MLNIEKKFIEKLYFLIKARYHSVRYILTDEISYNCKSDLIHERQYKEKIFGHKHGRAVAIYRINGISNTEYKLCRKIDKNRKSYRSVQK